MQFYDKTNETNVIEIKRYNTYISDIHSFEE